MAGDDFASGSASADVHSSIMNNPREFSWCCPGHVFSAVAHYDVPAAKADCDARYPYSEAPGAGCNTFGRPWIAGPAGRVMQTRVNGVWKAGDAR